METNFCKDCNKELSRPDAKRCKSCAIKYNWQISKKLKLRNMSGKNNPNFNNHKLTGKNNPMYGVHRYGQSSPGWQGGISFEPYGLEFNNELREYIRKRDGYKCQISGMTQEEHIKLYGRKLDVHHIDYNKKNNKPENLISLSQPIHMKTNYNRQYWTEYFRNIMPTINNLMYENE